MTEKGREPTQKTQPKGRDKKTGKPYEPVEIPVPTRGEWLRNMEKVAPPVEPAKDAEGGTQSKRNS